MDLNEFQERFGEQARKSLLSYLLIDAYKVNWRNFAIKYKICTRATQVVAFRYSKGTYIHSFVLLNKSGKAFLYIQDEPEKFI